VPAPAIQLEHLGKRYGRVTALRDLSLEIAPGEVFGFLGLNGAGKTTTIRILLDLVRPTAGRAAVFGMDCQARGREVRSRLGYLPGEPGFYGDTTGEATLDLLGALSGDAIDRRWRTTLLDRLELAAADLRRPLREYSTGMKRKLGLVQAFQGDPELLVLDEPTEGLDPLMQDAFYGLVAEVRARGRTVFMSSHVLPEVERVCDRIGLRVRVSFAAAVPAPARWPDGWEVVEVNPRDWDLRVHGALGDVATMLAALPIADLEVQIPHLEEILKVHYGEKPRA